MEQVSDLRKRFNKVVADYVATLLDMFDWEDTYDFWVGDDCSNLYIHADYYTLSLQDIIYIVDNNVSFDVFSDWYAYREWAYEFDVSAPNLSSWVKGCPHASKEGMERIINIKRELDEAIKTYQKY